MDEGVVLGPAARLAVAGGLLATLIACSARPAPHSSPAITHYGQDAFELIKLVPECRQVARVALGTLSSGDVVGTCSLGLHEVVIYTWPDAASERAANELLATGPPNYSASGTGWSAVVADPSTLSLQKAVVTVVATALHGVVQLNR